MKMKITVAGTGYVGLVTGVCLAEVGHNVICYDIEESKIEMLKNGKSPIYEPGIEELINKNLQNGNLRFTTDPVSAYSKAEFIFIAVGTPESEDGSANLSYVEQTALTITKYISRSVVIVTKSTVPVGTNEWIKRIIKEKVSPEYQIDIVSNPEFLREGTAVHDSFHAERIVIGSDNHLAADRVEEIFAPFQVPIVKTNLRSAETIKYAANAFLATKISFINEVANFCEKTGADIEDVAKGMGMDSRIGNKFLNAGIGFGGSCFPKDTKALQTVANEYDYHFRILDSVIEVNNIQKKRLIQKAKEVQIPLNSATVAVLGLAFKPNTDDIREAPAIELIEDLLKEHATIKVYDPIALNHVYAKFGEAISYFNSIDEAILNTDCVFITTEWNEIRNYPLDNYQKYMRNPLIFDGRNCYSKSDIQAYNIEYHSIGRAIHLLEKPESEHRT